MNQNLGRYIALFLFFINLLYAQSDYTWSASSSKKELYLNEAVMVTYICKFRDHGFQYVINFDPQKESEFYKLHLLSEKDKIVGDSTKREYKFILFFKKPYVHKIKFEALMRKTTKGSIEEGVIGRDNVVEGVFVDTKVELPTLEFNVKDHNASFTGVLKLESKLDKSSVKAYEPTHLTLQISGEGNLEAIAPYELNISGVKIFTQEPQRDYKLSEDGFRGSIIQKFSLVSDKNFKIPQISFRYFDLNSKKVKTLSVNEKSVEVLEGYEKEKLLDEDTNESEPFAFKVEWLYYLFIFVAGFFLGRFSLKHVKKSANVLNFSEKIEKSKSLKELLTLLIITDDVKYRDLIYEADRADATISLRELKKRVINFK